MNEAAAVDQVKCPKCKAAKTEPCTYVPFKVPPEYARSRQTLDHLARVGKPTKRPHNERMDAFRKLERDRFWAAVRNERLADLAEAVEVHDARMAYGAAVRQETRELVCWLRQNATILWSFTPGHDPS